LVPAALSEQTERPDAGKPKEGHSSTRTGEMGLLDDKQQLQVGDRVSFRILEDRDEPKALTVSDTGELEVPYLGRIRAREKTCRTLAFEIKAQLEKKYYYRATVILAVDVLSKTRGKVYVVGQVRTPGPIEISVDEVTTVSKAILRAGGFGDFADKRHVKLSRRKGAGSETVTLVIDVSEIWEKGRIESDVVVQPDDMIFVPERLFNF
jgi:polysaccharide export outer membrane protein